MQKSSETARSKTATTKAIEYYSRIILRTWVSKIILSLLYLCITFFILMPLGVLFSVFGFNTIGAYRKIVLTIDDFVKWLR